MLCEDTRRTRGPPRPARHLGAAAQLSPPQRGGADGRAPAAARAGERVALVSDAGLPGVNDPGARLIAAALEAGFRSRCCPGRRRSRPRSSRAGSLGERYQFLGYLPAGERRSTRCGRSSRLAAPAVAFESPQRLPATLRSLAAALPERPVAVCRELTKRFEEVVRGTRAELAERFAEPPKGEITLVLGGGERGRRRGRATRSRPGELVAAGSPRRQAADLVARLTGAPELAVPSLSESRLTTSPLAWPHLPSTSQRGPRCGSYSPSRSLLHLRPWSSPRPRPPGPGRPTGRCCGVPARRRPLRRRTAPWDRHRRLVGHRCGRRPRGRLVRGAGAGRRSRRSRSGPPTATRSRSSSSAIARRARRASRGGRGRRSRAERATRCTTAPHVHLGVRVGDGSDGYVDPLVAAAAARSAPRARAGAAAVPEPPCAARARRRSGGPVAELAEAVARACAAGDHRPGRGWAAPSERAGDAGKGEPGSRATGAAGALGRGFAAAQKIAVAPHRRRPARRQAATSKDAPGRRPRRSRTVRIKPGDGGAG